MLICKEAKTTFDTLSKLRKMAISETSQDKQYRIRKEKAIDLCQALVVLYTERQDNEGV